MEETEDLDETAITEIMIDPDGRIFVFGLSREVAEVLKDMCPDEHPLVSSLAQLDSSLQPRVRHDSTP